MKFIGIDFGWRTQPSGLCCLSRQPDGSLQLTQLNRLNGLDSILNWVDQAIAPEESGVVAVDAPTLIPNPTGMRLPDRLAHRHFGKYHAGCYPANLGSPFAQNTLKLGLSLEQRGFAHAPTIQPKQAGRFQIEVFPHPAMIHLFQLDRILKYKKGKVAERRAELERLRQLILRDLPRLDPALNIDDSEIPTIPHRGVELKAVEDQLDSVVCAYVAAHWWHWGLGRNQVLGDRTEGYIVVPTPFSSTQTIAAQPPAEG